jgi:ectoine hydroxylase-related dioxygenase (phytanoyl-CoA dioxygenase family)
MRFTAAERDLWLKQGYLVGDKFLDDDELDEIGAVFLATIDQLQKENRLENVKSDDASDAVAQVFQIRTAHRVHPLFDRLIRDPRLLDAIESLIGPNIRLVHFQGLYKPPRTGGNVHWHQDDYYFGVNKKDAVASCWLALDDATVENGCMWVVPGAHNRMYDHQKNWDPKDKKGFFFSVKDDSFSDVGALPIELKRGQCLFHHGLMPHRSLNNISPRMRRAFAMHFFDATVPVLRDLYQSMPPENTPILRHAASA